MTERSERTLYTGHCFGGPMHGQEGQSRFPEGFVIHDTEAGVFLGTYVCKGELGQEVFEWHTAEDSTLDIERAWATAEGRHYDVRAFDPVTMRLEP